MVGAVGCVVVAPLRQEEAARTLLTHRHRAHAGAQHHGPRQDAAGEALAHHGRHKVARAARKVQQHVAARVAGRRPPGGAAYTAVATATAALCPLASKRHDAAAERREQLCVERVERRVVELKGCRAGRAAAAASAAVSAVASTAACAAAAGRAIRASGFIAGAIFSSTRVCDGTSKRERKRELPQAERAAPRRRPITTPAGALWRPTALLPAAAL